MVILSGIVSCTVVEDEDIETRDAPPGCQPDVLYIGDVGASAGGSDDFVAKFDAHDGEFLGYLVPPGSSFLNGPAGIIVDKTNQVVLVDQNIGEMRSSEIWKLKPFGKPPEQLLVAPEPGTPLDPPEEPWAARGVIQIENVLYVVDVGITDNTGRITLWDSKSGDYLGDLPFDGYNGWKAPRSIVLGPDGYIYVSNTNIDADAPMGTPPTLGGSILRFDPVTGFDKVVYECLPDDLTCDLHRPEGLVFGPDGRLYVTSFRRNADDVDRILIFDIEDGIGEVAGEIPLYEAGETRAFAQVILFGPDDALYVPITSTDPNACSIRKYEYDLMNNEWEWECFVEGVDSPLVRPQYLSFGNTNPATLAYEPNPGCQ
jgi:hypothetical protein